MITELSTQQLNANAIAVQNLDKMLSQRFLSQTCFADGTELLMATFPAIKIDADLSYKLLQDMTDELFMANVIIICREQKELYPNTNIVALIRDAGGHLPDSIRKKIRGK